MGEMTVEGGPVLKSVLNPETDITAQVSETTEVVPLSERLMAEFLSAYKKTGAFREAVGRYNAFKPTSDKPMPLEIEYAAHPEDIYADIGDYVKDTLRPNRSNRNCQLALTLLEDRRPDAVSIFEAWKPIGKNYGNAILAALIEENLLKQEITREQFIINLKHAIRIEELRRTKGQSKKEKG